VGNVQEAPTLMESRSEVSAGGVVYRREDEGVDLALAARRTRRGQLAWGLAKGAIEAGESDEQAAVREVLEETGLEADVEADLGDIRYFYVWEDVRWFPLRAAIKRAAYKGEREVIERAAQRLA
jgi:8-oxo-dGTP pyrophosphatase MutT (NUDIX family)